MNLHLEHSELAECTAGCRATSSLGICREQAKPLMSKVLQMTAMSSAASSQSLSSLTLQNAQSYTRAGTKGLFSASPELQLELEVAAKAMLAEKVHMASTAITSIGCWPNHCIRGPATAAQHLHAVKLSCTATLAGPA